MDRIPFLWAGVLKQCIASLSPSVGRNLRLYIVVNLSRISITYRPISITYSLPITD